LLKSGVCVVRGYIRMVPGTLILPTGSRNA
jgi:hypothetical protein